MTPDKRKSPVLATGEIPTSNSARPKISSTDVPSLTDYGPEVTEALEVARYLAENGVPIFLAKPSATASTGYTLPKGWQTTEADPAVLEAYKPGMAVCAVMGHTVDAIDLDPRNGGELPAELQPKTYGVQSTPSGGTHELVAPLGVRSRDGIRPGVDIKAGTNGQGTGFIFIAPTVRKNHDDDLGTYAWTQQPDLDVLSLVGEPENTGRELAELIEADRTAEPVASGYEGPAYEALTPAQQAMARQAQDEKLEHWRGRLADAATWPEGKRDPDENGWEALAYKFAYALAATVATPWMPMTEADAHDAWSDIMPEVIANDPKCRGKLTAQVFNKAADREPVPAPPWADFEALEASTVEPADDPIRSRYPALDWHGIWDAEVEEKWLAYPILAERRMVSIYSPPKAGKSLLMLEIAAALATGRSVLGNAAGEKRRVLYVDFENDPNQDIVVRLKAMGYVPDDLDNLRYLSFPVLPALDSDHGGEEILAALEAYGCDVLVIDTVSRAVDGEENDNDTWLNFYRKTGLKLKQAGVTSIRLDHTGKDTTKGQRGGSAKGGDVDAVWRLTTITKDEIYRLDCELHRMPVQDTSLVIHREQTPVLHHRVNESAGPVTHNAKVAEVVRILDSYDQPNDIGRNVAREYLKLEKYAAANEVVSEALKQRKNRSGDGNV